MAPLEVQMSRGTLCLGRPRKREGLEKSQELGASFLLYKKQAMETYRGKRLIHRDRSYRPQAEVCHVNEDRPGPT